jgi:xylan 1,4-beta-xylosidase
MLTLAHGSILRSFVAYLMLLSLAADITSPQEVSPPVKITVDAAKTEGNMSPVWSFFGYDEPNYTYAPNGQKLLRELADLSPAPVYVRVHNLFTTGDGSPSLKWGSTNVYTENASGNPVYDWKIVDRIFDTFAESKVTPLVELGFMPQALSIHPEPYRHSFPNISVMNIYTGWAYPPKDYGKWAQLVFEFTRHLRSRYGDDALKSWLWEVWNEPDIGYWQGTPEEYFKLYDFSVDAVLRAFPSARIGGPETTGAAGAKAADFLRQFLEHCTHQKNYVSGKNGTQLDFISFHPKGAPHWIGDHVQMGLSNQLLSIQKGFQIIAASPEYRRTPIILGEWDPEGCAACSAQHNPQNAYRNGPLYATYTAEALRRTLDLAQQEHVILEGLVTWAFEFEDQPPFAGFRELATNGIDKPVLNSFRMFGLLGPEVIHATSSAATPVQQIVQSGVRGPADVDAMASRNSHQITVLIWNYHDEDLPAPVAAIDLTINGLPQNSGRILLEHFRVDESQSNAYAEWKKMGGPQTLTEVEQQKIQAAGQLQLMTSPSWEHVENGTTRVKFLLPRNSLSLLRLSW